MSFQRVSSSITGGSVADGTITSAKLQDGAVTATKLGSNSVGTTNIVDGAISSTKIAAGAINTINLVDNSVSNLKLAVNAVDTLNIKNGAVVASKIASVNWSTVGGTPTTLQGYGVTSTGNAIIYVDLDNGNDVNDGSSQALALKTVQGAISKQPKTLDHFIEVRIFNTTTTGSQGTLSIQGFRGGGTLYINNITASANNAYFDLVDMSNNNLNVQINKLKAGTVGTNGINVDTTKFAYISNSDISVAATGNSGILVSNGSIAKIVSTNISNHATGIVSVSGSTVIVANSTGTGNATGLKADSATIFETGTVPTGTAPISQINGGNIFSGNGLVLGSGGGAPDWSQITNKPTTIAGYGLVDAYPKSGGTINGAVSIIGTLTVSSSATITGSVTASNFIGKLGGHTYSVASAGPGTPLADDVWIDTTAKLLKRYTGSAWETIGSGGVAGSGGTFSGTVQGEFNVKSYGAVGNGVADDTAAIQSAVNAALYSTTEGGCLFFPAGTYKVTGLINIPQCEGFVIRGSNAGNTIIKQFTNNTPIFQFIHDYTSAFTITQLTFTYNTSQTSAQTNAICLYFNQTGTVGSDGMWNFTISDCEFSNGYRGISTNPNQSFALWGVSIRKCRFWGLQGGVYISPNPSVGQPEINFYDCHFSLVTFTLPAIFITVADTVLLQAVEMNAAKQALTQPQLLIHSCPNVTLINTRTEGLDLSSASNYSCWSFEDCLGVNVIGCEITGLRFAGGGSFWGIDAGVGGKLNVMGLEVRHENINVPGAAVKADDLVFVSNVSCINGFARYWSNIRPRLDADNITPDGQNNLGDANATLALGSIRYQRMATITANRTVTLPNAANSYDGMTFTIIKDSTAAFTLQVIDPINARNITLPSGSRASCTYRFNGTSWVAVQYNTIP
jgi:hypothetical protein